jgi:hypothetical protein
VVVGGQVVVREGSVVEGEGPGTRVLARVKER